MSTYAITKQAAPVYSTPEPQEKKLEFIAFPSTKFQILGKIGPHATQVTTKDYFSPGPLFVDDRFLTPASLETPDRPRALPEAKKIIDFMLSKVGTRYLWGGNWATGIEEMKAFYPHLPLTDDLLCKGIDCSGLLYQATNGFTPRNTSELCSFGDEIRFEDVRPLDMFVWKGHVVFVLDEDHTIESLGGKGVIISPLEKRHSECAQNKQMTIRRWIS